MSSLQDLHTDFEYARQYWDRLGLDVDFDTAIKMFNNSEYADPNWYAKPVYSEEAWEQMVDLAKASNESLTEKVGQEEIQYNGKIIIRYNSPVGLFGPGGYTYEVDGKGFYNLNNAKAYIDGLDESLNEGVSQDGYIDENDLEDIRDYLYDDTGINVEIDFDGGNNSLSFAPYDWEDGVEESDVLDVISDWCHNQLEQTLLNAYTVTDVYYSSGCVVADLEKWEEDNTNESLTEGTDKITVKLSKDDLDDIPVEELHPDYYDLYIKDKGDYIEITGYETNIWNALHPYDLHWRTTKVNENLTEGAMTNGSYSLYNGWVKVPDKDSIPDEYPELEPEYSEWVSRSNTCSTIDDIDNFLDDVYKLRQQGLLATGEYGKDNLIFKELRNNGILQRLKDMKVKEQNKEMSLESLNEAGYSYDGFLDDDDLEDVRDMIYDDLGINVEVDFDEAADVPTLIFEPDDKDPDVLDELSDWCHDNLESALNYNYICNAIYSDPDCVKVEIKADIDESCGKELNEAEETDTRAQELAKYLGVDVDEVKNGYTDNMYEVGNEEYWVLTEDEAKEQAKAGILDLVDDMGLQSFSPNFQDEIIDNYVDEDFIMNALDDEIDYYRTQEDDEETAEMLEEMDFAEAFNYFRDMFDKQDFYNWVKDHIDWDAVADEVIRIDGPENTLATYDGEEIQLDNYYAYRAN